VEESDSGDDANSPTKRRPSISLPQLDIGGAIELPSRLGSQRSSLAPSVTRRDSVNAFDLDKDAPPQSLPVVEEAASTGVSTPELQRDTTRFPTSQLQPSSGAGRLPFSANSSPSRDRNLSIASTIGSRSSSRRVGHDGNDKPERPSSMGYVAQHRTSDYIHQASPDEPTFAGSAAELVDEAPHGGVH
jgi:hypothetical protein